MKKVYYLKTCGTCTKILNQFDLSQWERRELKTNPISEAELDELFKITNSYEALFSKRSTQLKLRNIDVSTLQEEDYKKLILEHYSFLKRPVFLADNQIFIGNEKRNIENLQNFL